MASSVDSLLASLDLLIERYGDTDPQLKADLVGFRCELQLAIKQQNWAEASTAALRLASLVKFIFDHWPPT